MKKKLEAILEDELVNWVEIKKWEIFETDSDFADYLLNNYSRHWKLVWESSDDDEKSEEAEEKKAVVKKTAKKK